MLTEYGRCPNMRIYRHWACDKRRRTIKVDLMGRRFDLEWLLSLNLDALKPYDEKEELARYELIARVNKEIKQRFEGGLI